MILGCFIVAEIKKEWAVGWNVSFLIFELKQSILLLFVLCNYPSKMYRDSRCLLAGVFFVAISFTEKVVHLSKLYSFLVKNCQTTINHSIRFTNQRRERVFSNVLSPLLRKLVDLLFNCRGFFVFFFQSLIGYGNSIKPLKRNGQ